MKKLFGTDGVRGIYGDNETLNDNLARDLGYCGTKVLNKGKVDPKIIVATDTRESGENLKRALSEGIIQAGGKVIDVGIIPTPAVAVLIRELKADMGVVISASHNPYQYNGIKFFDKDGYKLLDDIEACIEEELGKQKRHLERSEIQIEKNPDAAEIYLDFLIKKSKTRLDGKKIVLDCSNGANYKIAPEYFKRLGAEVVTIGDDPNGININENCGSTHIDLLVERVKAEGADFGFAFDGDADRCIAVDELGEVVDGDKILYLISKELKRENRLNGNTLVITEMANIGLVESLEDEGIDCIRTDVGDRYVLERMQKDKLNLGGEQSGHIILLDENSTGDGLLTAASLAEIFAKSDKPVHSYFNNFHTYPQIIVSANVDEHLKYKFLEDPAIAAKVKELESGVEGIKRVNIRASGTEHLVRVMLEGEDQQFVNYLAHQTADLIESRLK